jgi:hypothetical protein
MVSPNPAGYFVNLGFNAEDAGNVVISIVNQTGTIVLNKTLPVTAGENNKKLDISSLANGMYFIKLQYADNVRMAKIIIRR